MEISSACGIYHRTDTRDLGNLLKLEINKVQFSNNLLSSVNKPSPNIGVCWSTVVVECQPIKHAHIPKFNVFETLGYGLLSINLLIAIIEGLYSIFHGIQTTNGHPRKYVIGLLPLNGFTI